MENLKISNFHITGQLSRYIIYRLFGGNSPETRKYSFLIQTLDNKQNLKFSHNRSEVKLIYFQLICFNLPKKLRRNKKF